MSTINFAIIDVIEHAGTDEAACETLVEALAVHGATRAEIAIRALDKLGQLAASNVALCLLLGIKGACVHVLEALKAHTHTESSNNVAEYACCAIYQLSNGCEANAKAFVHSGAVDVLEALYSNKSAVKGVSEHGVRVWAKKALSAITSTSASTSSSSASAAAAEEEEEEEVEAKEEKKEEENSLVLLYYLYIDIEDVKAVLAEQLAWCRELRMNGRVRVACEGINGCLDATQANLDEYTRRMDAKFCSSEVEDKEGEMTAASTSSASSASSSSLASASSSSSTSTSCSSGKRSIHWKVAPYGACPRRFFSLSVKETREVISFDFPPDEEEARLKMLNTEPGKHLLAEQFHEELANATSDLVVIDVRNFYETRIGRFEYPVTVSSSSSSSSSSSTTTTTEAAAEASPSPTTTAPTASLHMAKAIDPQTRAFSDFRKFCDENADEFKSKKVLMYCTGGVRCERASSYLRSKGVDDVYQLFGGIHAYQEAFPDGGFFKGKNFVYDPRIAVAAPAEAAAIEAAEAAAAAVAATESADKVRPSSSSSSSCSSSSSSSSSGGGDVGEVISISIVGKCMLCECPYDDYSSKTRCCRCRTLLLVCDACRDKCRGWDDKGKGKAEEKGEKRGKESTLVSAKEEEEKKKQEKSESIKEGSGGGGGGDGADGAGGGGGGEEVLGATMTMTISLLKLECEKCLKDPSWVDPLTYLPGNISKGGGGGSGGGNENKNSREKKKKKQQKQAEEEKSSNNTSSSISIYEEE